MSGPPAAYPENVARAMARLRSLHDGDMGVIDAVICGPVAIPALQELLHEREPSGLYRPRCLAVEALAKLGAKDVLIEFLRAPREAADPVERTGEDAVINAAARALRGGLDAPSFDLLVDLTRRGPLPGVIEALGGSGSPEAIPSLIDALDDDSTRSAAETALVNFGPAARPSLMRAAVPCHPAPHDESESSLRRRRSALHLLIEIGLPPGTLWPALRDLIQEKDPRIAAAACQLILDSRWQAESRHAVRRLIALLGSPDWMIVEDAEDCLVRHYEQARHVVAAAAGIGSAVMSGDPATGRRQKALQRTIKRGETRRRRRTLRADSPVLRNERHSE